MKTLSKTLIGMPTGLKAGCRSLSTAITFGQSMMNTHTCPCCSYTLLRHVRLGELYWRCSHCHAEMPVLESVAHLGFGLEHMLEL